MKTKEKTQEKMKEKNKLTKTERRLWYKRIYIIKEKMTQLKKRVITVLLICFMILGFSMKGSITADADETYYAGGSYAKVEQNGYLYYIKSNESVTKGYIYSLELSTGKTKKLVTEKGWIGQLKVSGDYLYYGFSRVSGDYDSGEKRVSIKGGKSEKILDGTSIDYINDAGYIYSTTEDVYYYDLTTKTETKIVSGYYDYIDTIEDVLYFSAADTGYVSIYAYDLTDKKWTSVAKDKNTNSRVMQLKKLGDSLYFTSGTLEGTSSIFYGSLYCINAGGKISQVAKNIISDTMNIVGDKLCYFGKDYDDNHYIYDPATGKSTKYSLVYGNNGIEKQEIGAKTYKVDLRNKKKVTVFTYTTGTKEKNIKKFTTLAYAKKSGYTYYSEIQEAGDYVLINMMAYNSDWKFTSSKWFVIDSKGEVLAKFS